MLFGVRLANEAYPAWQDHYIAYEKLKKLLKENIVDANGSEEQSWSEQDEQRFVSALDAELEKVYSFVHKTYDDLSDRISAVEKKTEESKGSDINVSEIERELEAILDETTLLNQFCRLNYTGFIKIVKKHDRHRPQYQVKPLLQVRLSALPFHNEDYSPLLYRLSSLYSFMNDNFASTSKNSASERMSSFGEAHGFTTFKFWVHPENVMEVKTRILRHLPVLVYDTEGANTQKDDNTEAGTDPTLSCLYLDNSQFELYDSQLARQIPDDATPSLRLKWYGKLNERAEVAIERRDESGAVHFKEKNVGAVLRGEQGPVEKQAKRMQDRGSSQASIDNYRSRVAEYQDYIHDHKLTPVMRTTYTRTAFQIPGDDRVRAILDSDIVFIREDPQVRDPENWRRPDLDIPGVKNPLSTIRKAEYNKFPYSILELRLRINSQQANSAMSVGSLTKNTRHSAWVGELMTSHLVKEIPNFSKFIHGVAVLFGEDDDRLHSLPFWLSELENDIRQDPRDVYKQQKERLARHKQDLERRASVFNQNQNQTSTNSPDQTGPQPLTEQNENPEDYDSSDGEDSSEGGSKRKRRKSRLGYPQWGPTGPKLADAESEEEEEEVVLPPGVKKPGKLLRLSGPVKVETKVWLANERTFNRWLSVTTLLSAMTFALYNSLSKTTSSTIAERVAYVLFALTLFTGGWGYYTYLQRLKYITQRSERHLDAPFGPLVVGITLLVALTLNFYATLTENLRRNRELGIDSYFAS